MSSDCPIRQASPAGERDLIGYQSVRITSPVNNGYVDWTYEYEPPHADAVFSVQLNGRKLPGRYWGRNFCWSPCGEYIALESYTNRECSLYVIDVQRELFVKVEDNASAHNLVYPNIAFTLYGDTQPVTSRRNFSLEKNPPVSPISELPEIKLPQQNQTPNQQRWKFW
jgi:hypothetical protein